MNFLKKIYSFFASNSTEQRTGKQENAPLSSAFEDTPNITADIGLQVSTVWACVNLKTEVVASLPLFVYERSKKEGEPRKKAKQERIYTILHDRPNQRQTAQEFWEQMLLNFNLRGNCYAKIVRDKKNGECLALLPLSADQIDVVFDEDNKLYYVYSFENQSITYKEDEILHIKGPGNGLIGLSPLDYMKSSVGIAIKAQNHITKSYKRGAKRPGVMMTGGPTLSDEQRAKIKKEFGDIVSGDASELYLLEANFSFQPLGMSPSDMQLFETFGFTVQDIARYFGVPSILINDTAQTTSLGSSVQQVVDGFYKLKLRPDLERIEQAINQRVLTPAQRAKGLMCEFNMDALLRASLVDRVEIGAKCVQNGLLNRNEWRATENYQPFPGGEVYTAQVNLMPIELLGKQIKTGSVSEDTIRQKHENMVSD